jgi:predicted DNA-binding transcriptional regulator YafY
MRTFRVSRMQRVTMLAVAFERPARFDLEAHWKASTSELDQKRNSYRVVLSATPDAAKRLSHWCVTRALAARRKDAAHTLMEVDFDHELQARFFILGFGSAVQVLEPEPLRRWVTEEARQVAEWQAQD